MITTTNWVDFLFLMPKVRHSFSFFFVILPCINAFTTTISPFSDVPLCSNTNEIKIGDKCYFKRNFGRPCLQSRMCKTRNALCLDQKGQETNSSPEALVPKTAFCGCLFGSVYNQIKDECRQNQLCLRDDNCDLNYACKDGTCVCRYEHVEDHALYLQKCVHNETESPFLRHPNVVHLCPPGQFGEATSKLCLQYVKREPFDGAVLDANWTLTLWKLLVLSTILISLMLLIRRVKKARMYDESIRLMYLQRDATLRARSAAVGELNGRAGGASRQMAGSSHSSLTLDLPPSYNEAITMKQQWGEESASQQIPSTAASPPYSIPASSSSSSQNSSSSPHPPPPPPPPTSNSV